MKLIFNNTPPLTQTERDFLNVFQAALDNRAPKERPADWEAVFALASLHQVAIFLYPILRTWPRAVQPPPTLMARWTTAFLGEAAHYTRVAIQIRELLSALHAQSVRVIPLKGVWLAENVYDDGTYRPMSDIDLLVPFNELALARKTVERLGYTTPDYYLDVTQQKHIHYRHGDRPLTVELHWRLWGPNTGLIADLPENQIWTGLNIETLHGVPVSVFSPERQLVYLAQHILQHRLAVPLKAYLDLVLICRRYADLLTPLRIENEATAWHASSETRFALQVAQGTCGISPRSASILTPTADSEDESAVRAAVCATLRLTEKNVKITPELDAYYRSSRLRRLWIGFRYLSQSLVHIRQFHPQLVRRFGLVSGCFWRCADLFGRHGKVFWKGRNNESDINSDLSNFATRQALIDWMRTRDTRRTIPSTNNPK